MQKIRIQYSGSLTKCQPILPASKSESNRALMMLAYSGGKIEIENLSKARDTRILNQLLKENPGEYDAKDAGTTFRFLTTFLALKGEEKILTGSSRMKERPIGILVDKLNKLGAQISFLEKEGFPPIRFEKGDFQNQKNEIEIEASQSSQFISSLLLAAPNFPKGLTIKLLGEKITSLPYIQMTLALMQKAGISYRFENKEIHIPNQNFQPCTIFVESDWSALGYWLTMLAFSDPGSAFAFENLFQHSLQGDSALVSIFTQLGLQFQFEDRFLKVEKTGPLKKFDLWELDFSDIPDQGQTIISLCAGLGQPFSFTGLESLAIKETNRLLAMKTEMKKFGISLEINEKKGTCSYKTIQKLENPKQTIDTYEDHRMAMALAPLSMLVEGSLEIENPSVVQKSYPDFWLEMGKAGFWVAEKN